VHAVIIGGLCEVGGDSLLVQWTSHTGGTIVPITHTKCNYRTMKLAYHCLHISENVLVANTAVRIHQHDTAIKTGAADCSSQPN
jgi:hypothetical protein